MKKFAIISALTLMVLICCQCSLFNQINQAERADKDATPIQYKELSNYFVRNDVDASKISKLIFDNKQDFEGYFGKGAVMGGLPTEINWKTQYVIAVVLPETNRTTTVSTLGVSQNGNNVIFKYHVERGEKTSYTMVPFAAVAVNKPANAQQMEVYFYEK